ncbi:hypothetical protein OOOCML_32800 (plasmid) [Cupriavidus necator H16]|uniref:HypC/HybG/HupF family hydrogenase formation chaperone n=1 Tax=Cupriavidus necator (strain ATCC 17699 / DSM 428 / KCTC 22496 / NCIMB 10442 / H16 / Stanier 337) TaxID=381666 RepID=A0AAE5ZKK2_CUPNH|nr:hypothetical protein E6A55_32645 [Cupriavidus necator H16]
MCLAIPARIAKKFDNDMALIDLGGVGSGQKRGANPSGKGSIVY